MSLLDLLMDSPSTMDRFQQVAGMGSPGVGTPSHGATMPGNAGGSPSHWKNVAERMATNKYGYTPQQFRDLDAIISGGRGSSGESSWDPNAVNPNGGAYGIPQILPSAHPDVHLQNDPRGQIKWLLDYVEDRYGGPTQALDFKVREGWY